MVDKSNKSFKISLNIADFPVTLVTDQEGLYQRLAQRYAAFLVPEAVVAGAGSTEKGVQEPLLTIELEVKQDAIYIEPVPGPWIIESEYKADQLTYRSFLEQGTVDWQTGRGYLEMHQNASVENFLRVIYAWLALQDGGLLLHAAGLIRDGEGYVFFGPSGAGKTTTTRLSANQAEILSDDLVILRCGDGVCTLYGVPFKGELSDAPRANQRAKLKAIFRLQQDNEHYLEPLPPVTAVAELVASSPFVVRDLNLSHKLIGVCREIAQTVPVQMLHFKKDNGFWKVIDGFDKNIPEAASANGRPGH